jgi:hypothetical protein
MTKQKKLIRKELPKAAEDGTLSSILQRSVNPNRGVRPVTKKSGIISSEEFRALASRQLKTIETPKNPVMKTGSNGTPKQNG